MLSEVSVTVTPDNIQLSVVHILYFVAHIKFVVKYFVNSSLLHQVTSASHATAFPQPPLISLQSQPEETVAVLN
jgi:hypothetical protein